MLDQNRNEKIVDAVRRELLTPYGLRTLARGNPKYVGIYSGDRISRDKAYHNGTVWPWLLGPFTTAFLKAKGYAEYRREQALNFLLPIFTEQINRAGLGLISEIFDGEPPHNPRGCIAQAWSIAEPLRAYVEDVLQIRPKHEREIMQKSLGGNCFF
jgi:glycogen debranching enzyme